MKKRIWISAVIFMMLITGCAQGNSANSKEEYYSTNYETADVVSEEGYAAMEGAYEEDLVETEKEVDPAKSSEKLVYRANLTVQTLTYGETIQAIKAKVNQYKGMIEYENEYTNDYYWYDNGDESTMHIQLTLRIPTENFEAFLKDVDGSAKVISKSTQIENITKEYNDNSARIEALETQLDRLLEMMEQAKTIDEMIAVETRLTEVQAELNQLKSYRESMNTDVQYSTVILTIDEVKKYSQLPNNFFDEVKERFISGLEGFVNFFVDIILAIIYLLPFILLVGLILFVLKKTKKINRLSFPFKKKENKEKKEEKEDGTSKSEV